MDTRTGMLYMYKYFYLFLLHTLTRQTSLKFNINKHIVQLTYIHKYINYIIILT